jgi:hypothetical protein
MDYLDINHWDTKDPTPLLGPDNVIVSSADFKPYKTVTPYWFDAHGIRFDSDAEAAAEGYYGIVEPPSHISEIYYVSSWTIAIEGDYAKTVNILDSYPMDYAKRSVREAIATAGLIAPDIEKNIEEAALPADLAAIYEGVLGS